MSLSLQNVAPPTQLAVLGNPIAHSKSPLIHRAAYRELGLDWHYRAIRCGELSLDAWLAGRGAEWRGFSLTMPLKERAHQLAVQLDPIARDSGVVNTLLRLEADEAGAPRWAGFNTDVLGLARAIARAELDPTRTVVLGAGATAVSAVLAARSLGAAHITVRARKIEAARNLAARFAGTPNGHGAPLITEAAQLTPVDVFDAGDESESPTLVVSTLPGHGVDWAGLAVPVGSAPLFDVAYSPWPSPGSLAWQAAGGVCHSGVGMLVEQALLQVRIFVSGSPQSPLPNEDRVLEAMRAAAM